jgi:uncharacterized tellurite resistance protein B-like protein
MSILRLLGLIKGDSENEAAAQTDAVRKITEALDSMEPERARYVACFAYILSRAARADMRVAPEETRAMERLIMEMAGLPEDQAIIVVQMAKTQNRLFGGTENYLVSREFNQIASREQKIALLHCLFAVSASDDSISTAEDSEIRQIASELLLDHRDFIEVRTSYREKLKVLKLQDEHEG